MTDGVTGPRPDEEGPGEAGTDRAERLLRDALANRAASVDPGQAPRVSEIGDAAHRPRSGTPRGRWTAAAAVAAGVAVVAAATALALDTDAGPEPVAAPTAVVTVTQSPAPSIEAGPARTATPTGERSMPAPSATASSAPGPAPSSVSDGTGQGGDPSGPVRSSVIVWASVLDARSVAEGQETGSVVAERRPVELPADAGAEDRVSAALTLLTSAPPRDPDFYTGWWWEAEAAGGTRPFDGSTPVAVEITGAGTTVDLPVAATRAPLGAFGTLTAVDELVRTVVSNGGTSPVTVLVDGEVADLWGAVRLEEPVTASTSLLTGGWVLDPYEGQRVPAGRVTVSGTGTAFEANVLWEVTDADGEVVAGGFTSAGANGEYGPFSFTVELDPGRYTVAVREPGMAGADEGPALVWQDTKTIDVIG